MPEQGVQNELSYRDGSSQRSRQRDALLPDYVAIDERSMGDLLEFVRQYAKELRYFDADNQRQGSWSDFLSDDIDLDEIVAFCQDAKAFLSTESSLDKIAQFQRPHFALLLAFLKLLQESQAQLNTFTERHLNFYFQKILSLKTRGPEPDRVHVFFELAKNRQPVKLNKGVELNAGKDVDGKHRVYQIDSDLIVNHARIAECRSVFVDSEMIGISQARQQHLGKFGNAEPVVQEAFLEMLRIALGRPTPGDALPVYADGQEVNYNKLQLLKTLVNFTTDKSGLGLQFSTFNELIKLKHRRDLAQLDGQTNGEWLRINRILRQALATRTSDAEIEFNPRNPRDFDNNLKQVIGLAADQFLDFSGLPQVKNTTDLYRELLLEGRREEAGVDNSGEDNNVIYPIQDFIAKKLYLQPFIAEDEAPEVSLSFEAMMQIKVRIDAEWTRVNDILEQARRFKEIDEEPIRPSHSPDFDNNFHRVVKPDFTRVEGVNSLDTFHEAITNVEEYFYLPAPDIAYLFNLLGLDEPDTDTSGNNNAAARWDTAHEILTTAHKNLALKIKEQILLALQDTENPLMAMLQTALLKPAVTPDASGDVNNLLNEIMPFTSAANFAYFSSIAAGDITVPDWRKVARALAIAQRNIEGGDPIPAKEQWYNLYAAEDAKQIKNSNAFEALDAGDSTPSWLAFGAAQTEIAKNSQPPLEIGWAFSSPLLFLEQGVRKITLTLYFAEEGYDQTAIENLLTIADGDASLLPFRCEISGNDVWVEPDQLSIASVSVEKINSVPLEEERREISDVGSGDNQSLTQAVAIAEKALRITMIYNPEALPLIACSSVLGLEQYMPVLRVLLRQYWQGNENDDEKGRYISHYQVFHDLRLTRVQCEVDVKGLSNLQLQNDHQTLQASSPFEPFGPQPTAGARLYLGHRELLLKPLDSMSFTINWMGLSNGFDFSSHYVNYGGADFSNDKFNINVALWERAANKTLFNIDKRQLFENNNIEFRSVQLENLETYSVNFPLSFQGEVKQWDRYLTWELGTPDFQHGNYSALANRKAIELAAKLDAGTIDGKSDSVENYIVNPPYTPKIKQLSIDYQSRVEINLYPKRTNDQPERLLHIHPFGYSSLFDSLVNHKEMSNKELNNQKGIVSFLPSYSNQGELYIGLTDLQLPQNVSVLFQMAQGSADPDLETQPIRWSYLSENGWLDMVDGDIVNDSTNGLIQSGIIEFSLRPVQVNTLLPQELYWIRASVDKNTRAVCSVVALHTQAVAATFVDQNNAIEHYSQPLPAQTTKRFVQPIAGIKNISQPYTSFDGREPEQDSMFHTRVSERLRHKQRCINVWDYEHVVLAQFPQIFKARCMPVRLQRDRDVPGELTLVVIPDIRNRIPFESFAPKVSRAMLADIQTFIDSCKPMSAVVHVNNPFYIQVKVRLSVRFRPGRDESFYKHQLNQELKRFLSPWAYDEGTDIIIGGKIFANNLIYFVEQRPYIDYVTDVKLFSSEDDGKNFVYKAPPAVDSDEGYFIDSVRDDGVLVAAQQHIIDVIPDSGYQEELFTGINFMKVELDFQVG